MKKNHKLLITILFFYAAILISLLILVLPTAMDIIRMDMLEYMSIDSIMIIVVSIVVCLTALIITIFTMYNKNYAEESDEKTRKIYMDEERSYLERQINEINKKLVSTDERWKEAYNLIISSQDKQIDRTGKISSDSFLKGFGIETKKIEIEGDLAFVLMPFHNDFTRVYDVICQTCKKIKIKPMRGDEEYIANDILKHIIQNMVSARLIIAVLDGRNPNVFYELGIAHALNKPTILLANKQTSIPFDLQNQFLILYEDENELQTRLENALLSMLTLK